MNMSHRVVSLLTLTSIACTAGPARGPVLETEGDPSQVTGIVGTNCAGAPPSVKGPDGVDYEIQSVQRYYNLKLQGAFTRRDGHSVLQLWLHPAIEGTDQDYYAWQAKSAQIFRSPGQFAHAHRYYRGLFGFLDDVDVPEGACSADPLTDEARDLGTLGQVATSQKGVCGKNDDDTDKFWQVNNLILLLIGRSYHATELIAAGIAEQVTSATPERCILQSPDGEPAMAADDPISSPEGQIPCALAYVDGAVTEGIGFLAPSLAVMAGESLGKRAFTAGGVFSMPNDLDQARTFMRDPKNRAMRAHGLPIFQDASAEQGAPGYVRLVGHPVGPTANPSPFLRPEEQGWVEGIVGTYAGSCCRQECTAGAKPSLDGGDLVADNGDIEPCTTVCDAEEACPTATLDTGLVVMVTPATTKECFGSCPEAATGAPSLSPTCKP